MRCKSKKARRVALAVAVPVFLLFWFITAPAGMAIQRIVSGSNGGPIAHLVSVATDWYESPMLYVGKIPALRRMNDSLTDRWCEMLGAPETTP